MKKKHIYKSASIRFDSKQTYFLWHLQYSFGKTILKKATIKGNKT